MSLTQLQAYYQPWLKKRSLKKELLLFRRNTRKLIKSYVRRAKVNTRHYIRTQYYLHTALADARSAAVRNEDIVITMSILALIIGYSTAAISLDLLITAFSAVFAFSDVTKLDSSIFIILTFGSLAVIAGWLMALIMNMQSIALMDGANRKRTNTIRTTVRKSLKYTSRVTYSWLLMGLLIFGIPATGVMVASIYLSQTSITMLGMLEFVPYAIIGVITWAVLMLMEYGLVPYIMLFEPQLSFRQTMSRSHELIKNKGRVFILAADIALGMFLGLALLVAQKAETVLGIHRGIHFFGYSLILVLIFNAVMTAFYRKRKLARK